MRSLFLLILRLLISSLRQIIFLLGFGLVMFPIWLLVRVLDAVLRPVPLWLGLPLWFIGLLGGILAGYRLYKLIPASAWQEMYRYLKNATDSKPRA